MPRRRDSSTGIPKPSYIDGKASDFRTLHQEEKLQVGHKSKFNNTIFRPWPPNQRFIEMPRGSTQEAPVRISLTSLRP